MACRRRRVTPEQIETAARLLDDLYTSPNEDFLIGLLAAIKAGGPTEYCASHGYDVTQPTTWEALVMMGTVGPHFDLRLAGGVYRFEENSFGLSELFVNSAKSTIHVDGALVECLAVEEGYVSFIANEMLFTIRFQCAQLVGVEQSQPGFEGEIWPASEEAQTTTSTQMHSRHDPHHHHRHHHMKQTTSIRGRKYFTWGDSNDTTTDFTRDLVPPAGPGISLEKMKAAAAVRVDASWESIVVCMDLLNGCYDVPRGDVIVSPYGPVLNAFIGVTVTSGAAGIGAYAKDGSWPAATGAAIAAAGAQFTLLIVGFFRNRYTLKQPLEMKAYIRQYGNKEAGDPEGLLSWTLIVDNIKKEVYQLTEEDLKQDPKAHAGTIKSRIKSRYTVEAMAQIRKPVFDRFTGFRRLAEEEYRKVLAEGVDAKFEVDVSPDTLDKHILGEIAKRKARVEVKDLESQIRELQSQKTARKLTRDRDLDLIDTDPDKTPAEKDAEKKKINDIYEKDIERIEGKEREKQEKKTEAEKQGKPTDFDKVKEEFEREIREKRKNARDSQIDKHLPV